jgi:hypothetical protein
MAFRLLTVILLCAGCTAPIAPPAEGAPPGPKADEWSDDGPPASRVELKVTIEPDSLATLLDALGLDEDDDDEERYVTFYDTPELALFDAGVVLRSRKVIDGPDDSTVKIRPLTADEAWALDPALFELDDFKCERDRTPDSEVGSCSLGAEQDRGEIDEVAAGDRDVDKLFSGEQESFFDFFAPVEVTMDDLVPLGPVPTHRYRTAVDELGADVTVEHWELPDGSSLVEVSVKVEEEDADGALEALLGWIGALGISLAETQVPKTRLVLEHYAGNE